MGLQGHVFKAQQIHQSSSVHGSNPTSQREGKKGIFWYSLQSLFSFQKLLGIWFIIFPLGFLARLRNCPCCTADTIFTVAMPWWLWGHFNCTPRSPNPIWLQQQKYVQRGELTIAVLTALPKKICLLRTSSLQWQLAALMKHPHLVRPTDAINFSHPCLWEMLIMKTQRVAIISTAD